MAKKKDARPRCRDLGGSVLDHFGADDGAIHRRGADARAVVAVAGDEQDAAKVEHLTRLTSDPFYGDRVARFDAVLLTARFDNGVHLVLRPEAVCTKTPRASFATRPPEYTRAAP
jgi:hypothetical protein